jgi:pimeloyl-ACP methyl ester carboxylesterase
MKQFVDRFTLVMLLVIVMGLVSSCSKDDSSPTPPVDPNDTTRVDDKVRPVVFVHGYLEAADAWTVMAEWFVLNGYTEAQLHAFDFVNGMNTQSPDLATLAATLKSEITGFISSTGTDRVDIVAHGQGAKVVQYYITKLDGYKQAAHIAYCGGLFDESLKYNNSLVPGPCKYMTVRSDGADTYQGGNSSKGTLAGASDKVVAGMDHQQLISTYSAFANVFGFFTNTQPQSKIYPSRQVGKTYVLNFKVVDMFDNTPVPDATVRMIWLKKGTAERQVPARVFTSDPNGNLTVNDQLGDFDYELWVSAAGHFDMHIHRQAWRSNSKWERIRMIPSSGGSSYLQAFRSGLCVNPNKGVTIVFAQNQSMISTRDGLDIDGVQVLNTSNAPQSGAAVSGSNTMYMCLSDFDGNGQNGSGPASIPAMNTFGVNSFDMYLDASIANIQSLATMNNRVMAFLHWRSGDMTSEKLRGIVLLQFEYF